MPLAAAWPKRVPATLPVPQVNVVSNLQVSAARYPGKTAIVYYDTEISYAALARDVEAMAGFLASKGVRRGDRVILDMQNSPHFVTAYYAIMRADACVVPLNPMQVTAELEKFADDCGARVAFVGLELAERMAPLLGSRLDTVIVASYGQALVGETDLPLPPGVFRGPVPALPPGAVAWGDALASGAAPGPMEAGSDDIACMPYTSGTTGKPKGCVHTHASVQAPPWASIAWNNMTAGAIKLAVLPFFHVTGMEIDMNSTIAAGATMAIMTRWDALVALELIRRYKVTHWTAIATMVMDFISRPGVNKEALATLQVVNGGGAPLPEAVSDRLYALTGLRYQEGYGMSETISMTHANAPGSERPQCLGMPVFDVDSRIVDPETLAELPQGEIGEIVMAGPQIMREYWNRPEDTAAVMFERDGKRFLRSGDLGWTDADGSFFMVDRLKRMINASGFKVWPAEVEATLYAHPAIQEVCVIATHDPRRGETTKAVVIPRAGAEVTALDIIAWAKERMSAYKVPTVVEFVDTLPRSATGKVQWRELQEDEMRKCQAIATPQTPAAVGATVGAAGASAN